MIEAQNSLSSSLEKVGLLSTLKDNKEALDTLARLMGKKSFQSGHTLISEGEMGDELYILIEGQVSIYKRTPEGDTYKVAILKSNISPAFGEGGLIDSEPRSATVKCDTECVCLVLNRVQFQSFCDQYPQWAVPILKKLSTNLMARLRQTNTDLMLLHKALMTEIRG